MVAHVTESESSKKFFPKPFFSRPVHDQKLGKNLKKERDVIGFAFEHEKKVFDGQVSFDSPPRF
jgi:hypothetical protein